MDVTFTNVLEGARQYFQGLPAATSAPAGPTYSTTETIHRGHPQQQQHHYPEQNKDIGGDVPSSSAYWPPPQDTNRPRASGHQSDNRNNAYQPNYQDHNQMYHFSRPHSREAPSNQYIQQQNTYQHQPPSRQDQMMTPPASTNQTYHQMQNSNSQNYYHQQPASSAAQGSTSRPYYSKPQIIPTGRGFKTVPSQNSQANTYYKHLYSAHVPRTSSGTPPTSSTSSIQMQYTSKQHDSQAAYRTTHNLPPIASLSHTNFNSIKTNSKSRATTATIPTSSSYSGSTGASSAMRVSYAPTEPIHHQQRDYRGNYQQTQNRQTYQYSTTATTQNYTQVIMTTSNTSQSYTVPHNQSSSNQYYQTNKHDMQRTHHQPMQPNVVSQSVNGHSSVPAAIPKQKRESPLDLSVKTVRTPADSTLDDAEQDNRKYYRSTSTSHPQSVASHNYPTYDVYANSFQRNMPPTSRPSAVASAPKVEFHPNFNVTSLNQNYRRNPANATTASAGPDNNKIRPQSIGRYPTVSVPTAAHVNSYIQSSAVPKRPRDALPRIDFPPPGHGHKTSALYPVPTRDADNKRAADTPPPSMIPNKMSKVDTWRQSIDQQIEQRLSSYQQQQEAKHKATAAAATASAKTVNGGYPNDVYANSYQQRAVPQVPYPNNHNQTYVPSVGAHQYPGFGAYHTSQQPGQYATSPRTNLNKNNVGGADKRVLTLLRNSLENKGAKEAQKKLGQHSRLDVQHPSTDVTAPLQPKPNYINRHNVSPFTPTNLPENNMTMYKFHIPKAIDSVNFDADSGGQPNNINPNGDLDGLAAFLAARIRTKAELKQVGPTSNNNSQMQGLSENTLKSPVIKQEGPNDSGGTSVSPPKLSKEQRHAFPPRRRLFSRNEDDTSTNSVPGRDKSGMRSSSETSVFDFPDTDSEGEMPVLERQSLEDMRRDRKAAAEMKGPPSPGDDMFKQCCDSFMEQLKNGCGKKRGRRKKVVEPDVIAKLETVVTSEKPTDVEEPSKITENIKQEPEDDEPDDDTSAKVEPDDDDSDVPLNKLKDTSKKVEVNQSAPDPKLIKELPALILPRPAKKPSFGDGSDFCPGWEEEVYKYKKSLRMPPSLIQVTRPPHYHRLSTSLPDLDPCPQSPTPSLNDYSKTKHKIKLEHLDSDNESNNSFNFFGNKSNYDSEGGSSIKSLPNTTKESSSILDKLLERCGGRKKRKYKRKDEIYPKVIPKPEKLVELLPTPAKEKISKPTDVVSLGFRKKTINNFKDVFNKNVKELRSRKNNRQRFTIKEVFGEDRPASAPPVTCLNNLKIKEELTDLEDSVSLSNLAKLQREDTNDSTDTKQVLKNKLLNRGRKDNNLLKSLVDKKIKTELLGGDEQDSQQAAADEEEIDDKADVDSKSETPSIDGEGEESGVSGKKQRNKFTKIRRKLSSGFDYIRKKKKSVKKDTNQDNTDATIKAKQRKNLFTKNNPGSVQDIQKEIKGWVLNKGIGETILHRSARLGYTDITAYCLEKMECSPSPKDNAGYTPLHEASTKGHLGIAKMLLMYGANVSESARGGIRPLHEAVENGYVEIVRLLLSYGADPMLATYAGVTPLALATDESTINLLQNHINDVQGNPTSPWIFPGPASCFDAKETGFNVLDDEPTPDPVSDEEDIDFEMSEHLLPNLYTLRGESSSDRWVLLQDLSNLLKIKSRDALLRQICATTTSTSAYKSVLRELKMSDFLEQAHCCQFLNIGEKINTRASKIALVKYTDKVKELLKVDKISISVR